jgi:cell wall assembly regulator SMI1
MRRAQSGDRVHNRRVQSQTIDLIERVRHRLNAVDQPCVIAGPASEEAVAAAEETLGIAFPPSYRTFLRRFGQLALPQELAVVHDFLGISKATASDGAGKDVVSRTLAAREENQLAPGLVVVGIGAQANEWFCLDTQRASGDELPVVLFDAGQNVLDQVFYDDFESMVREVLEFVEDTLSSADKSVG